MMDNAILLKLNQCSTQTVVLTAMVQILKVYHEYLTTYQVLIPFPPLSPI